jgi:type I restriction enzyme M protein
MVRGALANLILHNIDEPHVWHGNTLTGAETYGGLFTDAPALFDVILMNPPFGGKEGKDAQTRFVLFRTNETAFAQTKRKLLDECDLWCIVSLPSGAFVNAGAGVKTNLLFFTRGKPTERIWYYDLSDIKMGKKRPLTLAYFEEFFRLLAARGDSDHSWTVERKEIEARGYDLKAVNPNAKRDEDVGTPEELLDIFEAKGREVTEALAALRAMTGRKG